MSANALGGDSGAPVFFFNSDGTAILYGIVRAQSSTGGLMFTSMDMIRLDLNMSVNDYTNLRTN